MTKPIMYEFKEVFLSASTNEQRKKLIHLLVSKITIDEEREIDSIELQINSDVVRYLMEDRLPKQKGNLSFLSFKDINCGSLKFVICMRSLSDNFTAVSYLSCPATLSAYLFSIY
ncbi:hypothetical protein [Metaclostridioides mangenotii]|uniref:hypothetical protein n=1 Tax=Metaclostridioides mangenotii TaxID=1540 RepID=UPI0004B4A3B7|nr:hypothetical protein [Clostridioides mangenotii]